MTNKNNRALSLCVDKVLDHVGASEQIRRNHVEKGLTDEVVLNLMYPCVAGCTSHTNVRFHNFGSWCEGTTTKGLASDVDKVSYDKDEPAVEQIYDGLVRGCLIINDGTTKPGYVKLQLVRDGIPMKVNEVQNTNIDQFGRFCSNNRMFEGLKPKPSLGLKHESTGPALTSFGRADIPEGDSVFAYRCFTIPSFANGWLHRPRKYDWPSDQLLDKMSTYGCLLVGKGHPSSQAQHLEWRISFSFQERELMFSLNSTQHKCYILLKMIKQYLVSKMNEKSISSYHLKTSLFYTIENNPTHIWIPDNLVYCTELCLKQLLDWLNNENCPNFFVSEENMFDRLSSDVMKMTATFIRDMLDGDGQYLMLLTCDKFGHLLQESMSGKVLPDLSCDAIEFDLQNKIQPLIGSIYCTTLDFFAKRGSTSETLSALKLLLKQVSESEEKLTSEGEFREVKNGVNLILPAIHLQIAQAIAAIMLNMTEIDKKRELMQEFDHHIEQANDVDVLSQRLVKASLLFKQNKLEECERILTDCETSLEDCIIRTCTFALYYHVESLINTGTTTSMSPLELRRKYLTSSLMFLPSQADLAPTPLQYEMYRSVGADTDTVYSDVNYWFGAIAVHPKVYLFFLQYLVYTRLNKHELATCAKVELTRFLFETTTKRCLTAHRETGFNLLGWIFKHEKFIEVAAVCFYLSWQARPDHNAAKWHMLVMIYEHYIQRSKA